MYTPMYYPMGIGQVVNCRKQPALHAMQLNSQPGSILHPVSMGSPAFFSHPWSLPAQSCLPSATKSPSTSLLPGTAYQDARALHFLSSSQPPISRGTIQIYHFCRKIHFFCHKLQARLGRTPPAPLFPPYLGSRAAAHHPAANLCSSAHSQLGQGKRFVPLGCSTQMDMGRLGPFLLSP